MKIPGTSPIFDLNEGDIDEHFKEAVEMVVNYDRASASLLQRRLQIGYARAARLIDQLEAAGVVGPAVGANPREVLIRSPKELFGEDWEKLIKKEKEKKEIPYTGNRPKDPFSDFSFWFKVLKVSLVILLPYWLFGFEAGVLVGIIFVALFLSKISLTLIEINEYLQETRGGRFAQRQDREGKMIL